MKMMKKEEAQEQLDVFLEDIKTVVLSTVDKQGEPFASYSPFVQDEESNFLRFCKYSSTTFT